jgi:hypothetical protein
VQQSGEKGKTKELDINQEKQKILAYLKRDKTKDLLEALARLQWSEYQKLQSMLPALLSAWQGHINDLATHEEAEYLRTNNKARDPWVTSLLWRQSEKEFARFTLLIKLLWNIALLEEMVKTGKSQNGTTLPELQKNSCNVLLPRYKELYQVLKTNSDQLPREYSLGVMNTLVEVTQAMWQNPNDISRIQSIIQGFNRVQHPAYPSPDPEGNGAIAIFAAGLTAAMYAGLICAFIGSLFGPVGMVLGGVCGGIVGGTLASLIAAYWYYSSFYPYESEVYAYTQYMGNMKSNPSYGLVNSISQLFQGMSVSNGQPTNQLTKGQRLLSPVK